MTARLPKHSRKVPRDLEYDTEFCSVWRKYGGITLASPERTYAVWKTTDYILQRVRGDICVFGVYLGGYVAFILDRMDYWGRKYQLNQQVYLYDTYEGMPNAESTDYNLRSSALSASDYTGGLVGTMEEVRRNLSDFASAGKCKYIKGLVEETLKWDENRPSRVAFAICDTDWYRSTRVEMDYLMSGVVPEGGIIFQDDMFEWQGARKATEETMTRDWLEIRPDDSARMFMRPPNAF